MLFTPHQDAIFTPIKMLFSPHQDAIFTSSRCYLHPHQDVIHTPSRWYFHFTKMLFWPHQKCYFHPHQYPNFVQEDFKPIKIRKLAVYHFTIWSHWEIRKCCKHMHIRKWHTLSKFYSLTLLNTWHLDLDQISGCRKRHQNQWLDILQVILHVSMYKLEEFNIYWHRN